jgi:hypothetical protein
LRLSRRIWAARGHLLTHCSPAGPGGALELVGPASPEFGAADTPLGAKSGKMSGEGEVVQVGEDGVGADMLKVIDKDAKTDAKAPQEKNNKGKIDPHHGADTTVRNRLRSEKSLVTCPSHI